MKLIKFDLYDSMRYSKSIFINPDHVEFIAENPEGKTDIGLASKTVWKVSLRYDAVKVKLEHDN